MGVQAQTNRIQVLMSPETNWGETPTTPAVQEMRCTAITLSPTKQSVQSETLRTDRMRELPVEVALAASGNIDEEAAYSIAEFGLLARGALYSGPFVTVTSTVTATFSASPGGTVTRAAGSWITDGVLPGQWIRINHAVNAGNNGIFRVSETTAPTALVLTLDAATAGMVVEAGTAGVVVAGNMIRNGVTPLSYFLQRQFVDLTNVYDYFTGVRVESLTLTAASRRIIKNSYSLLAKTGLGNASSLAGAITAAGTTASINGAVNLAGLQEGQTPPGLGTVLGTAIKQLTMVTKNNAYALDKIGSLYAAGVNVGFFDCTGTLDAYFEDLVLYNKMANHNTSSLYWYLNDDPSGVNLGNLIVFTIPQIKYTKGSVPIPAGNQAVMVSLEYQSARYTNAQGQKYQLQIDFLPIIA